MQHTIPGVFIENERKTDNKIRLSDAKITGFIGLAEKGPLHAGIRIKSYSQYKSIFGGFTDYSYLAYAVYGFFSSGGKECVVVRTAHVDNEDPGNSAARSVMIVNDINGDPVIAINATSEGSWGNRIELKIQHINALSCGVTGHSFDNGVYQITIDEKFGDNNFVAGDQLCLRGEQSFLYCSVGVVEGNILLLSDLSDNEFFDKNSKVICENIKLNISIINGSKSEDYLYLSPNIFSNEYFLDRINADSSFVHIENIANAKDEFLIENINYKHLQGGLDGLVALTPGDFIGYYKGLGDNKGLGIFEEYEDINLIAAPDIHVFEDIVFNNYKEGRDYIYTVHKAMIDQCERLGDRFAILDAPKADDVTDLLKWVGKFDSAYAALYYPRIEIINPDDLDGLTSLYVPPSGHIAGIYTECDLEEGPHRAPANKYIKGAVGLDVNVLNAEYEILYPGRVNCLKNIPGKGIKIWGARTLSSDISWRYINVRRTFSVIKEAIRKGTGWAVFEPNNQQLWKRLVRHITAFLIDLWRKGFLAGKVPEEAFFVKCDNELNYQEEIDAGRVNVEIGIAIAKPAEFIVIKMKANSDNTSVLLDD